MHCDHVIFPNLDFWTSPKHFSIISPEWNVPRISAILQPSTRCFSKQRALGLVDISSHSFTWTIRRSSLPTQPDEFGVALLSFSDVEPFFDGTRLDWPALILSC
ncbi:hypothetical protein BLNAU_7197 [Blattamonas nauphoetae]|uniref:Uncharacterized protein n=1 Tax=Blattamonas nauphoetae TaxID=2049346 RepID=A0ABQ9Y1Z4_9EUKA|nr:hypothetical protein BLNAU_7197 [Blattamonas nauphoetae]